MSENAEITITPRLPRGLWQILETRQNNRLAFEQNGKFIVIQMLDQALGEEKLKQLDELIQKPSQPQAEAGENESPKKGFVPRVNPKKGQKKDKKSIKTMVMQSPSSADPKLFQDSWFDSSDSFTAPSAKPSSPSAPRPKPQMPPPPSKDAPVIELTEQVVVGTIVEEDGTSEPKKPENKDATWRPPWLGRHRMLRANDTLYVLNLLFKRSAVPLERSPELRRLITESANFLEDAKTQGVQETLPISIPIAEESGEPPVHRLVGRRENNSFVLFHKKKETGEFFFSDIEADGTLQIALIEGEDLLSEDELTDLFQNNARGEKPTREAANSMARQVQSKIQPPPGQSTDSGERPEPALTFAPKPKPDPAQNAQRAIPVNMRLLNRFTYSRGNNIEGLWDPNVLKGMVIYKKSLVTLFIGDNQRVEGILAFVIKNNAYMVFDRRNNRYVPLKTDGTQRLWLRKEVGG